MNSFRVKCPDGAVADGDGPGTVLLTMLRNAGLCSSRIVRALNKITATATPN